MTEWTRRDHHRMLGLLAAGGVAFLLVAAPVARLRAHSGIEQHENHVAVHRRHRPLPRTGDVRSDAELIEHVQEVGFEDFLDEQFNAPVSSYPTLPLYPTTRDTASVPERLDLPARQLHDVSAAEPVLRQRALRRRTSCGSGSPSRCTRSSSSPASRSPSPAGWRRTCRCSTATRSATTGSCSTRSR